MRKVMKRFSIFVVLMLAIVLATAGLTVFAAEAAPAPINKHFSAMGEWTPSADTLNLKEAVNGKQGMLASTFGGVYTKNFKFEAEIKIAPDVANYGLFFRSASSGNVYGGIYARFTSTGLLIFDSSKGPADWTNVGFTTLPTVGEFVKYTIDVTGRTLVMNVKSLNGSVTHGTATVENINPWNTDSYAGISYDHDASANPYVENAFAIRKIKMTSGAAGAEKIFTAYPTVGTDLPVVAEPSPFKKYINPNFSMYTDDTTYEPKGGDKLLFRANHPVMNTSVVSSDFGGTYGENFTFESFLNEVPAKNEKDGSIGFYMRTNDQANLYGGTFVRVHNDRLVIAYQKAGDTAGVNVLSTVTGYFEKPFVTSPKLVVKVTGNLIEANVFELDLNAPTLTKEMKLMNKAIPAEGVTDDRVAITGNKLSATTSVAYSNSKVPGKAQYAGVAADKAIGGFFRMEMKGNNKAFKAFFGNDPADQMNDYVIVGEGARVIPITKENKDNVPKGDHDLLDNSKFPVGYYWDYDAKPHTVTVQKKTATGSEALPSGYTFELTYKTPTAPAWNPVPYVPQTRYNRHPMEAIVRDANGAVVTRLYFLLNVLQKKITITDVAATTKTYDTVADCELTGGKLVGVAPSDTKVSFTLGRGSVADANIGVDKVVKTDIVLTGENSENYVLTQPTNLKLTINKGKFETPDAPTVNTSTDTSVTLDTMTGAEYKMNDGAWQASNEFTGLSAGTEYKFYIRMAADANADASESSEALVAKTTGKAIGKTNGCGGAAAANVMAVLGMLGFSIFMIKKH